MSDYCEDIISYFKNVIEHNENYADIFKDLKNNFNSDKISSCYNYILKNSSDLKLLIQTIREINKTRYKDNLESLIDFVLTYNDKNEYSDIVVLAIKTISLYQDKSALNALLYCLNNKNSNYKIRLASAEALGKIGDRNAFESLSNVVYDNEEKSTYIKESAVTALGMLGDVRAIDVFSSIINTKEMFLGKFSYLKERIIEAMSKLDISKDKKALDILKSSLLDPSNRVRINTIETIMNSNIDSGYELIYERLKFDDDIEVKKNALVALYNISDRTILDEVINSDYEDELKDYAKEILNEYEENE